LENHTQQGLHLLLIFFFIRILITHSFSIFSGISESKRISTQVEFSLQGGGHIDPDTMVLESRISQSIMVWKSFSQCCQLLANRFSSHSFFRSCQRKCLIWRRQPRSMAASSMILILSGFCSGFIAHAGNFRYFYFQNDTCS
jgi:hypothetical protein